MTRVTASGIGVRASGRPCGTVRRADRRRAVRHDPARVCGSTHPMGRSSPCSSYGPGSTGNRPPAILHPMGLEGPLGWLAEQLEERDRAQMEWLWDLAPADLPRLERCVAAYERRYPRSNRSYEFRSRLKALGRRRKRRRFGKGLAGRRGPAGGARRLRLLGFPPRHGVRA